MAFKLPQQNNRSYIFYPGPMLCFNLPNAGHHLELEPILHRHIGLGPMNYAPSIMRRISEYRCTTAVVSIHG